MFATLNRSYSSGKERVRDSKKLHKKKVVLYHHLLDL